MAAAVPVPGLPPGGRAHPCPWRPCSGRRSAARAGRTPTSSAPTSHQCAPTWSRAWPSQEAVLDLGGRAPHRYRRTGASPTHIVVHDPVTGCCSPGSRSSPGRSMTCREPPAYGRAPRSGPRATIVATSYVDGAARGREPRPVDGCPIGRSVHRETAPLPILTVAGAAGCRGPAAQPSRTRGTVSAIHRARSGPVHATCSERSAAARPRPGARAVIDVGAHADQAWARVGSGAVTESDAALPRLPGSTDIALAAPHPRPGRGARGPTTPGWTAPGPTRAPGCSPVAGAAFPVDGPGAVRLAVAPPLRRRRRDPGPARRAGRRAALRARRRQQRRAEGRGGSRCAGCCLPWPERATRTAGPRDRPGRVAARHPLLPALRRPAASTALPGTSWRATPAGASSSRAPTRP